VGRVCEKLDALRATDANLVNLVFLCVSGRAASLRGGILHYFRLVYAASCFVCVKNANGDDQKKNLFAKTVENATFCFRFCMLETFPTF